MFTSSDREAFSVSRRSALDGSHRIGAGRRVRRTRVAPQELTYQPATSPSLVPRARDADPRAIERSARRALLHLLQLFVTPRALVEQPREDHEVLVDARDVAHGLQADALERQVLEPAE